MLLLQLPLAASSSSAQGSFTLLSTCSLLPARHAPSFPSRLRLCSPARLDGRQVALRLSATTVRGGVFAGGGHRSACLGDASMSPPTIITPPLPSDLLLPVMVSVHTGARRNQFSTFRARMAAIRKASVAPKH